MRGLASSVYSGSRFWGWKKSGSISRPGMTMSLCVLKKDALRSPSGHRMMASLISARQLLKIVGPRAPGNTNTWSRPPLRAHQACFLTMSMASLKKSFVSW